MIINIEYGPLRLDMWGLESDAVLVQERAKEICEEVRVFRRKLIEGLEGNRFKSVVLLYDHTPRLNIGGFINGG